MEIINKNIEDLIKYNKNPRNNEKSINEVAKSIKEFGFKVPIIIDNNNVIICGHTRLEASKLLGLKKVPCIVATDLSEEQIRAFRIVDNKVAEYSRWDYEKLKEELKNIKIDLFDYDIYDELDVSDDDFISDTEITKEKKEKKYICPECGEEFK